MPNDSYLPKIDQYLDAELPADEMRSMAVHLRDCSACAADALQRVQLRQTTKLAGKRYTPSIAFRRRVEQQIAPPRRRIWMRAWVPASAALLAVVAIALTFLTVGWRSQPLLTELADLHVANLAASTPVDVVSSNRHTVKPWFQGKLPFSFDLPEVQDSPFTLVGGRITYLNHEPGAHLIYNVSGHHISVFIFRNQPALQRAFSSRPTSSSVLSFHVESWTAGELRYFVFGDAGLDSIRQLSELLKTAARSSGSS
jgi:anti-sigma factor RsiW